MAGALALVSEHHGMRQSVFCMIFLHRMEFVLLARSPTTATTNRITAPGGFCGGASHDSICSMPRRRLVFFLFLFLLLRDATQFGVFWFSLTLTPSPLTPPPFLQLAGIDRPRLGGEQEKEGKNETKPQQPRTCKQVGWTERQGGRTMDGLARSQDGSLGNLESGAYELHGIMNQ